MSIIHDQQGRVTNDPVSDARSAGARIAATVVGHPDVLRLRLEATTAFLQAFDAAALPPPCCPCYDQCAVCAADCPCQCLPDPDAAYACCSTEPPCAHNTAIAALLAERPSVSPGGAQ